MLEPIVLQWEEGEGKCSDGKEELNARLLTQLPPIPTSNEHNGNVASSDINPDDDASQEHDPKNDD